MRRLFRPLQRMTQENLKADERWQSFFLSALHPGLSQFLTT